MSMLLDDGAVMRTIDIVIFNDKRTTHADVNVAG